MTVQDNRMPSLGQSAREGYVRVPGLEDVLGGRYTRTLRGQSPVRKWCHAPLPRRRTRAGPREANCPGSNGQGRPHPRRRWSESPLPAECSNVLFHAFHIEFTAKYPVERTSTVTDQDSLRNVENQGYFALREVVLVPKALGEGNLSFGTYCRGVRHRFQITWSCYILYCW